MNKWSVAAWWLCVKRKFLPMIVSGLIIGILSAIKIDTDLIFGLPLVTAGTLGTVGPLMFGTISWLFLDPEVFTGADAISILNALDEKVDGNDIDAG